MRRFHPIFKTGLRLIVCLLLLTWIFHAIFAHEARVSLSKSSTEWDQLPRDERWRVAWTQGPAGLWKTLSSVRPGWMALSLGYMGLTLGLGVSRWKLALGVQQITLPWGRAAEISLVAHFFNSFLLGSTGGDLIKAYYAARETNHLKTEAVVTVIVDRVIGLFAMLAFGAAMMPLNWSLLVTHKHLALLCLFVLAMFGALTLGAIVLMWGGLSKWLPRSRAWLRRLPKGELLERSMESCRPFGKNTRFLARALLLSALLNLACVLQVDALARGLNLSLPPLALLLIVPCVICVSALPITPSGLGVRENLFVLSLATPQLGIPAAAALSLSILAYAGSLIWSLAGGVVYLFFRDRHHLREVAA